MDTIGGYHEEGEGDDIDEPSFLAAKRTDAPPEENLFGELFGSWQQKYHQEGVIIKLPGEH